MSKAVVSRDFTEAHYMKILRHCFSNLNDAIKIVNITFEEYSIRIMIKIEPSKQIDFIILKNVPFFSNDELIEILMQKLKRILLIYS